MSAKPASTDQCAASAAAEGASGIGCQVTFQPVGKRVSVDAGSTILEAGRSAGMILSANCGGVGVCGRCRVTVLGSDMEPPAETESACLSEEDLASGVRLACRAQLRSNATVHIPAAFLGAGQRLQIVGDAPPLVCDPLIRKLDIKVSAPSLDDSAADFARICRALPNADAPKHWHARPATIAQLSSVARSEDWHLTAYVRDHEVIGFAPSARPALGIAVDLGCTKIAAYLVDLQSGAELASGGESNPQISYGEDLITRLVFAGKGSDQAALLAACVRKTINDLCHKLSAESGTNLVEIVDFCIVGNTAMIHLLLALPVMQLLHAPFIAGIDTNLDVAASELDLLGAPGARVHVLPSIGGFVGADHVAMIMARDIDLGRRPVVGVDIGTNTEIVLCDPESGVMLSTSVPSGPTFEGGHIHDGMRAAPGAIEAVFIHEGEFHLRTIDHRAPVGICGSGVIDLVAQLWLARLVNDRGHLQRGDRRVRHGKHGLEFVLVEGMHSGHGRDIVLTQQDISEVQLAKAAVMAGIQALLEITATAPESVAELVVAGAFGSNVDLASAVAIGVLPRLVNARYSQVGNAAGVGAKMALVSHSARERAQSIAQGTERVELKEHLNFNRLLARATRFPTLPAFTLHGEPQQ